MVGMRFAAPPVGDLRFRAPRDPPRTNGTQSAAQFRATCLGSYVGFGLEDPQEDCLFVNVFTPSNATTNSKLPVWFYIQGGGYSGNTNANYNGTEVVMKSGYGVILVNMNYRVGAFGFLASEKVRRDGDLNVGLLDQRKAMQWVQKYIHLFGGDPNHVVIHGASAGAGSIAYHLTAYNGRNENLFAGAISESTFFPTHRTVPEMEFQFARFAHNVSCPNDANVMPCLRSKDLATLQSADYYQPFPGRQNAPDWYFLPVVDGTFSPDLLYNLLAQGRFVKVPLLTGHDTDEGNGFAANAATNADFLSFLLDNYPNLTPAQIGRINATYPLLPPLPLHAEWFPSAAAAYGDSTFKCPSNYLASTMSAYFSPNRVWNYHYNVLDLTDQAFGSAVPHTAETPAIFGPGSVDCGDCSYTTYNAPIVPVVMSYFISFVRDLDPNPGRLEGSPYWGSFGRGAGRRLRVEINGTGMEGVGEDQRRKCEMWRGFAQTMEQ
ncbi:hypothetical protein M409DRAFT_28367 [Zasmidium cellare ATCC 36951]|uniref:Carboxylic ester hydrolase n=1 Tax=Zasmidium cellare ATCC 36951 TaxID=1080233 RepID=A0A6A6C564_ZASCE|nr:uncharacterized protein M409DRAFT_28367 [Zasmidium cellare ATCC 36951]KAF2161330.1 hypothetical protein M409DRAFT_28367 [Zasmidium cellare ATCC 36951]